MSQHEQAEGAWRGPAEQKREDVLSLPPRREVHRRKKAKKRAKWKLKYPLIRLLALFFISLPVLMLGIYYANNDSKIVTVVTRSETGSYEQIDIAPAEERTALPSSESSVRKKDRPPSDGQKENGALDGHPKKQKTITHTVQENETLYSIAMKYYQSDKGMEVIKKWNHLKSMQLHKGQVLQIPMVDVEK
ncbi:LysM domain-containing protein [Parageobacillus thermantarcticus]|uniref:LysM domain-containing protein n=1 Tax=Parageobacillus thermantarcticus TaxID=186116 RepID=A0A1I0TU82_9BACL|nr:LysM domain-containing protein [Parageobacillus thermantarcticus]SFA55247.1 LysM domain-containing protein [Parageobacillus thermantarcticus]